MRYGPHHMEWKKTFLREKNKYVRIPILWQGPQWENDHLPEALKYILNDSVYNIFLRIICCDSLLHFKARVTTKLSQVIGFASCPEITLETFNSPDEGTGSLLLQDSTGEDSVLLSDLASITDSGFVLEVSFFFLSSWVTNFDSCCSCEPNINKKNKCTWVCA